MYVCILCRSCVRVVTSKRGGMGKSLYIKRRKEKLMQLTSQGGNEVIVPLHGPLVTADNVVEALKECIGKNGAIIFHLDIASNVGKKLELKVHLMINFNIGHRYCGRLMQFCSACWYSMVSVIAREECGAVNQHTST